MRCWKCGRDNTDGATKCLYCDAEMKRTACKTEEGEALRKLYDQFGPDAVFTQKSFLTNGLGDYLQDSTKLRNQLRMAMEAGIGELYLRQLRNAGKPDTVFRNKARKLIVDDAGLSDQISEKIMGYFDEMIGWESGEEETKELPKATVQEVNTKEQPNSIVQKEVSQQAKKKDLESFESEQPKRSSKAVIWVVALLVILIGGLLIINQSQGWIPVPWASVTPSSTVTTKSAEVTPDTRPTPTQFITYSVLGNNYQIYEYDADGNIKNTISVQATPTPTPKQDITPTPTPKQDVTPTPEMFAGPAPKINNISPDETYTGWLKILCDANGAYGPHFVLLREHVKSGVVEDIVYQDNDEFGLRQLQRGLYDSEAEPGETYAYTLANTDNHGTYGVTSEKYYYTVPLKGKPAGVSLDNANLPSLKRSQITEAKRADYDDAKKLLSIDIIEPGKSALTCIYVIYDPDGKLVGNWRAHVSYQSTTAVSLGDSFKETIWLGHDVPRLIDEHFYPKWHDKGDYGAIKTGDYTIKFYCDFGLIGSYRFTVAP